MSFTPFSKTDSHTAFSGHLEAILSEIDSLENAYVLGCSQIELEQYYCEQAEIDPLVLSVDDKYIQGQKAVQIDVSHDFRRGIHPGRRAIVPGTRLELAIPFSGDKELWNVRPSTFGISGYREVNISDGEITLEFESPDDTMNTERLKEEIDREVSYIVETVTNLARDVELHNNEAPPKIQQRLERKREKALSAVNAVSGLGIPIKRTESPPTYAIPANRRNNPVTKPKAATQNYLAEPVLPLEEYKHIIEVLSGMSLVIERNPKSFYLLDEESIRDHFLIQLNGHYQGNATGETFNSAGKTDILIREQNRNVFIAECKFWRGQKGFNDAIDQLLSYLTWRDCKAALLIFNQKKDVAAVAAKMHDEMEKRSEHRKTVTQTDDAESRYIFVKDDEPGREIIITTMLFNIPEAI